MSLTNIKLPDTVIADLYRQTLVQDETLAPVHQEASTSDRPVIKEKSTPIQENARGAQEHIAPDQTIPDPIKTPAINPVPEQKPAATTPTAKAGGYKTLGNNKKNISIIVQFPDEVFVPESELQFLTKMLGACKLNLADVSIVNHATSAVEIEKLKEQLQPRYVLLFGVDPTDILLPINFPSFKEQPYAGTTYLFSPGLSQLNQETDEAKQAKRKLWDCLKRMFV